MKISLEEIKERFKVVSKSGNYLDLFKSKEEIKVETLFQYYLGSVYQGVAMSSVQYREIKKTFFAGFSECLRLCYDMPDRYSDDDSSAILSQLTLETNAFIKSQIEQDMKDQGLK